MPAADQSQGGDPQSLIRALREHRDVEENFRRLFQLYYSAVNSYFSRKGFPPEDCRDLTQEVFVGVYTGLDRLRADDAFTAWLFTIARNVGIRRLERDRPARAVAAGAAEADTQLDRVPARDIDQLTRMLDREKSEAMRSAIESLPGREQDCIRGRVVDSLSNREIAQRLGISENTVGVHIHRGMKSLRARLRLVFGDAPFAGDV